MKVGTRVVVAMSAVGDSGEFYDYYLVKQGLNHTNLGRYFRATDNGSKWPFRL